MRLIDADALMKAMYHRAFETDGDTMWQSGCWVRYRAVEQTVREQPTVDAVPVVRCKDCKYYGRADKRRFYRGMDCLNKHIDTIIPDKDYCSKAERREDG